jgi:hypothetical protein
MVDIRMNGVPHASGLGRALDHVRDQLVDGLRHGFFEFTITCEIVKDRKRRLVVKAGKSEQFTIAADELER